MQKNILVFSNGEKLGDGIIKIQLLYEIKRRLPNFKLIWVANGTTVYNNKLKLFSDKYIDLIIENANLKPFFWQKITTNRYLLNSKFHYIFDTQKAVMRTIALKRLNYSFFISNSAKGFFSNSNLIKKNNKKKYYLDELIDLLDIIIKANVDNNFKIPIIKEIEIFLFKIFKPKYKYIGIAPGAGEKDKIWPINNFINIAKYFENKLFKIVWFLGPDEKNIKQLIKNNFPNSIYPEELTNKFSSFEIIMATTKYLSCALTNDSGISHILSTKHCPLIKLFGKKDPKKFTPIDKQIITISADEFNSNDICDINEKFVIDKIGKLVS